MSVNCSFSFRQRSLAGGHLRKTSISVEEAQLPFKEPAQVRILYVECDLWRNEKYIPENWPRWWGNAVNVDAVGSNPTSGANSKLRVGESGRPYLIWSQGIEGSNPSSQTNLMPV